MSTFKRHRGNFANCLEKVAKAIPEQILASVAQLIDERMRQGVDADICTGGVWGPASFNEVSGKILVTRAEFNPLLAYPNEAVEAMRTGEFYLTDNILLGNKPASQVLAEIAEADAKKPISRSRVLNLGKAVTHLVPTDCFADDEAIVFPAEGKRRANKYGLWLRNNADIKESRVYMQDLIGKDKSRGFWLVGLGVGGRADFDCDGGGLGSGGGSLFGVYESAEGTPQKILPYTERTAERYIALLERVTSGKVAPAKVQGTLEPVIAFFRKKQ